MPYTINIPAQPREQIRALPDQGRTLVYEALRAIELVPWSAGEAYRTKYNANKLDSEIVMRKLHLGPPGAGFVDYLILDEQDTVELLEVFWSD